MIIIVICLLIKKKSLNLKMTIKILGSISNRFGATGSTELCLKRNVFQSIKVLLINLKY